MATKGHFRTDLLVDTEWVETHLHDSRIRVVDCDPFDSFRRAHIPGAVGIRVHHYIKHPDYSSDPKANPLVAEPDVFKDTMEKMGIGDDATVVAYDSNGGLWATRLWWALNYYGHNDVKVLNGGWNKWFDESRPISIETPAFPKVTFTPKIMPNLLCSLEYGKSQVGIPDTLFIDVRTEAEWNGSNSRGNGRRGHIPGAVHLEWLNFLTNDRHQTFKTASELCAMVQEFGITPDQEIITY